MKILTHVLLLPPPCYLQAISRWLTACIWHKEDTAHETTETALLTPKDVLVANTILTLLNQSAAFDTKMEETINNNMYQK